MVRPTFGHKFNFCVNIWEQNTETEKTKGFWSYMDKPPGKKKYVFPSDVERTVDAFKFSIIQKASSPAPPPPTHTHKHTHSTFSLFFLRLSTKELN